MEKPKLFEEKKEFFWTIFILFLILLVRLGWEYRTYQEFISKPFYFTEATVLNAYEKHKEKYRYQVLKLHDNTGHTFYTTTHRKDNLFKKTVRVQLFPDMRITFWDYLGTFYVKSRIKYVQKQPTSLAGILHEKVASQHTLKSMQVFYSAIFFATPLSGVLREKVSLLGISHLIALSGFHLGILWAIVYGLLLIPYRPLQQYCFPYRFALIDIGIVSLLLIGLYVWFVGAPPSLLRAYVMLLVGWIMLVLGLELLSFKFLFFVLFLLVMLVPSLLVSLGFWFSIIGVFYIYLLLYYAKGWSRWHIMLWIIPLGIFILMLPIVHTFFSATNPWQLISPLLSLLFIPFYPITILLHLFGYGDIFDNALQWLFALPQGSRSALLSVWKAIIYIGLSLVAIKSHKVFYVLFVLALSYALYLFVGFDIAYIPM
ncbi:MAG: ComEC/Rec2 family competence protein [Sulfurovum sp.]|nr:ComEC/Rec2 family competence protein [Sulfurovum sp.]MCB4745678.1 ComEC/Rec2 family competence protein [Sulfurovum sp.]MCB4749556.1 ComEC/Rec2 family competence protein [Sulfurovum sp.]MCB4762940.1 ComEC/Rec2 family competence protein [Sulfurovum sp.]MCB4765454.1 ComEC/Rec2 family competence protein [Sulfurovum sp.]